MPNEMNHAEVAERLEDMADASDRESTGPMYLGQHVRTGLINVPTDDAGAMRIAVADERCIANGELVPAPVKCGECKYFLLHPSREFADNAGQCTNYLHIGGIKRDSDFCSYGERKDDNHETD